MKRFFLYFFILIQLSISNTSVAEEVLFYMEKASDNKACEWFFLSPESFESKKMHRTRECHQHILFHNTKKNMIYLDQTDILLWDMSSGTTPKKLGSIPKIEKELFGEFVITPEGRYRISRYIDVEGKKNFIKGGQNHFVHNGVDYPEYDLPWGVSALAEVLEFKNDTWNSLYITATKYDASDTPGFSLVKNFMQPSKDFSSLKKKLNGTRCIKGRCRDQYKSLKHKGPATYDFGYIPLKKNSGIISNTKDGSIPHFTSPLYFCTDTCKSLVAVKAPKFSPLAIQLSTEGSLLIAREFSNEDASLYKFGEERSKKSLPKSLYATWIIIP